MNDTENAGPTTRRADALDHPYRRIAAAWNDPEPPRVGEDLNMTPAWSLWEMRQAERSVRHEYAPREKTPRELVLERMDAKIEEANMEMQRAAMAKTQIERELEAARISMMKLSKTSGYAGEGPASGPGVGAVRRLESDCRIAIERFTAAKAREVELRVDRSSYESGMAIDATHWPGAVDPATLSENSAGGGRRYSYNTKTSVLDGKTVSK